MIQLDAVRALATAVLVLGGGDQHPAEVAPPERGHVRIEDSIVYPVMEAAPACGARTSTLATTRKPAATARANR